MQLQTSRIPDLASDTFDGMLFWFAEMSANDLIFHPDDAPDQIFSIRDGTRFFTQPECVKLDEILAHLFEKHGDRVHEACYPVYMKRFGIMLDA